MKSRFKMEELMEMMTFLCGKKCPVCGSQKLTAIDTVTLGTPKYGVPLPPRLLVECEECGFNMLFTNIEDIYVSTSNNR